MRYVDEKGVCVACRFVGVDLHHIKTRKSGGSDEPHNLMPLCHRHHVEIHALGIKKFSSKKGHVHVLSWLLKNGWTYDPFFNKWNNEKEN